MSIEKGSCTIIAGANGSGKSIWMSIIVGLKNPSSGAVKTSGRISLVFQEPDSQILGETLEEGIAFGPMNMGMFKKECASIVETSLEQTWLKDRANFPVRSLSGGERRRLAAAGVIALNPQIIIFDEPYANMDSPGVVQVNELIKKNLEEGKLC